MAVVDSPFTAPVKRFTTDEKAHKSNLAALESFGQSVYGQLVPVGSILAYGGSTAPPGWVLCDGAAISRSTYYTLFLIIGTQFGAGDGSTTFNVPNLKGASALLMRAPAGGGALGSTLVINSGGVGANTVTEVAVNFIIKG